ncbi:MAG: hypothetical protein ACO3JL_03850 [Myxococcota bacterium]
MSRTGESALLIPRFAVLGVLLAITAGCANRVVTGCRSDDDCQGDNRCLQGDCVAPDEVGCTDDSDCDVSNGETCRNGECGEPLVTSSTAGCQATRECSIGQYCNPGLNLCQDLLSGWCRESAQCPSTEPLCSASTTDEPGRCVQCLRDTDCGGNGTCVNPGVCEVADDRGGPTPGNGDVDAGGAGGGGAGTGTGNPGGGIASDDPCVTNDWYGDGVCDDFCLEPDPDCAGGGTGGTGGGAGGAGDDYCEAMGWYGDGICDDFCAQPDPDCAGGGGGTGGTGGAGTGDDYCEAMGWYGDGICDDFCAQPDPDCGAGGGSDICAYYGWYGDGYCDLDCAQPDPDCTGTTTTDGLAENASCVSGGEVYACATGFECIYGVNSGGVPTYGSCKRLCQSNADCPGSACAVGFLSDGSGICGNVLTEGQQGCTFWEESNSFCFGSEGTADSAFLECLSGTCRYICDYDTNTGPAFDCPGTRQCSTSFSSYDGYSVDLAVCQ